VAPAGGVSFVLDASAGATFMPELLIFSKSSIAGFIFNAEGGYTFDGFSDDLHAFHVTAGAGYGAFLLGGLVQPRFIIGRRGGELAIGMRNGLRAFYFGDLLSLEIAHQFVHVDELQHDVRLMLGVSPWAFAAL
jgi:hypothetical protein